MIRLAFAALFHEYPASARALVASLRSFYPGSPVYCGIDRSRSPLELAAQELRESIGLRRLPAARALGKRPFGRGDPDIHYIEARRAYSWRNLHRFLFDVIEQKAAEDFDFLVLLDSDTMLAGEGLSRVCAEKWDFSYVNFRPYATWCHGKAFREHWGRYRDLALEFGVHPEPHDYMSLFALFILSKRAVAALAERLGKLSASPHFRHFEDLPDPLFPFYEAFFPQFLADLGMKARDIGADFPGLRWRPYWRPEEYDPQIPLYHPVRRHPSDPFRKLLRRKEAGTCAKAGALPCSCASGGRAG